MSAALPAGVLPQDLASRLALALSAGKEAGRLTLKYFQQDNYAVERKADQSPVTIADRSAEELLRSRIAGAFPADGIIGEEFGRSDGTSGYTWILDPIDGTKTFISGVPLYGTLIGVEFGGKSLVGLIYMPGLDEGVYASAGNGAWHFRGDEPPRPAGVSQRPLSRGLFVTSQVDSFASRNAQPAAKNTALDVFHRLEKAASVTRTWGDCYGYLLVATGRAELMVDPILNVWDAAAVQPIIEEAGGTFTDWKGNPTIHAGEAVATNGVALAEVLAMMK